MRRIIGGMALIALLGCDALHPVRPAAPTSPEAAAAQLASLSIRIALPRETQALPSNTQSIKVLLRKTGLADRAASVNTGSPTAVTFAALPPGSGYTLYAASYSGLNGAGTMLSWGALPLTLASGLNSAAFGLSVAVRSGSGADDLVAGPAGNQAQQLGAQRTFTSMNDFNGADAVATSVEVFHPGQNAFLGAVGTLGAGNDQFSNAIQNLTIDSLGRIWVTDYGHSRVCQFDANGTFLRGIGGGVVWTSAQTPPATGSNTTNLGFKSPVGVAVDLNDNVYVADNANHRVMKYDSSGNFLMGIGNGMVWYASSAAPVPASGNANGFFAGSYGIDVGPDGVIYVCDSGNQRVQIFSPSGAFIRGIGNGAPWTGAAPAPIASDSNGYFSTAWHPKLDANGQIYVTDNTSRVQLFNSSGTYLRGFSAVAPDKPSSAAGFLGIGPTGLLYVVNHGAQPYFTQVFTPQGVVQSRYGTFGPGDGQVNRPEAIEWAADGTFWQTDRSNYRILHYQGIQPAGPNGGLRLTGHRQPDTPVFAGSGTYDTPPVDAGSSITWGAIHWNVGLQPPNTGVATAVATSSNGLGWGAWVPVAGSSGVGNNVANLTGITGRYMRVRLTLLTTDLAVSPEVQDVGVTY